jgi:hypothetical protein
MDLGWAGWTIVKAVVVGGIAAAATLATTPVSVPTIAIFGIAAGDASLWSDIISQYQIDDVKPTAAVFEPPVTETVPVPVRSFSQEPPPPPPGPPVLPSGFQAGAGQGTPPVVVVGPIVIDPPDPPPPPPPDNGDNPPGDGGGGDVPPGGAVLPGDGGGGDDGGEIDDKPTHDPF